MGLGASWRLSEEEVQSVHVHQIPQSHPLAPSLLGPYPKNVLPLLRAITLENTLVILSTVAPDAGRYYVQAVNDKNGDNKTSQPITLAVESK